MNWFVKKYLFRYSKSVIAVAFCVVALWICDAYIFPLPVNSLNKPASRFIYSRDGRLLNAFASKDFFWRKPVVVDSIAPVFRQTVINAEDKWFYYHPGFNPVSLIQAVYDNYKAGKTVRGGSTITMQIARMMEPKERTVSAKIIEILRAIQLELHYSKDELLELYCNLAPYGGNIEGIGAASYFYFGKSPSHLTLSEAAILTGIPASPNKYRPDIPDSKTKARRDLILSGLLKSNLIDSSQYQDAIAEEIPYRRVTRPFIAPHFCQSLISDFSNIPVLRTTIDFSLQCELERVSSDYIEQLHPLGIHNLAVVIIDNHSGELLAQIGSPDFNDAPHNGQINGALAIRSPGSALKPFAYALGIDRGLVTPSSRIDDIPVNYGGYSPDNYDETYHGIVTLENALIQSYNVPAVNLTANIGLHHFHGLLKDGGISTLTGEYYNYGLPLVLGACEVSLMELSNLYATLARGGRYFKTTALLDNQSDTGRLILSPEACYIVSDILSDLNRPVLNTCWEFTPDQPQIAWKTGTSYGRKDAWAIGYNPDYTIGVWTGNFSAESSPYIVGVESSAPLLLQVFRHLTKSGDAAWFTKPERVAQREVCAISGKLPGEHCPVTIADYYIRGVSHTQKCDVHKEILVDAMTGKQLCRACAYGKTITHQVVEKWPARLSNWLLKNGLTTPLPEHNPVCNGVLADNAPVIISPEHNTVYEIRQDIPSEFQKIQLKASASLDSRKLHWFVDDVLLATGGSDDNLFYQPEKGYHSLMCVDEFGRSSRITFEIK